MTDHTDYKNLIWDEYRYRHEHVWSTVFKLTFAAFVISVTPYVHTEVACVLGYGILLLPALAFFLCVFGYMRLDRELIILYKVRKIHRDLQSTADLNDGGGFSRDVKLFVILLCFVVVANAAVLGCVWVSAVRGDKSGATCFVNESSNPSFQQTTLAL